MCEALESFLAFFTEPRRIRINVGLDRLIAMGGECWSARPDPILFAQGEEQAIINKALSLPTAGWAQCSVLSSTVLSGEPSFPNVQPGTWWPDDLWNQVTSGR